MEDDNLEETLRTLLEDVGLDEERYDLIVSLWKMALLAEAEEDSDNPLIWSSRLMEMYANLMHCEFSDSDEEFPYMRSLVIALTAMQAAGALYPGYEGDEGLNAMAMTIANDLRIVREEPHVSDVHYAALAHYMAAIGALTRHTVQGTEDQTEEENKYTWASVMVHIAVETINLSVAEMRFHDQIVEAYENGEYDEDEDFDDIDDENLDD